MKTELVKGLEWCWLIIFSIIIVFTMIYAAILGRLIGVEALAFIFGIQWNSAMASNDIILILFSVTFSGIIIVPFALLIPYIIAFPLIKITRVVFPNALVEKDDEIVGTS